MSSIVSKAFIRFARRTRNTAQMAVTAGMVGVCLPELIQAQSSSAVPILSVASRSKDVAAITLKQPAVLHVGGVMDDPADEFDFKNSWLTAVPMSDGGIAVADGFKVRLFDKSGRQRVVVGKSAGAGPNEFKLLWRLCSTRGDTLILHDTRNNRMTAMTSAGRIVSETPTRDVRFTKMSCLDDGTVIVTRATEDSADFQMAFFLRKKADGTDAAPIGVFPISYLALGPVPYVNVGRGHEFVVADPNIQDIAIRDLSGKVLRTYRLSEKPEMVSAEVATNSTVYAAQGIGVEQAGSNRRAGKPTRVPWPLYQKLEIDPAGNLWLQDMKVKATEKQSWVRINVRGAVTGRLELPPLYVVRTKERTDVMNFTSDGVLIRSFDADGAAHFYRYTFN